ncbi:MAG: hypothetical protein H6668_16345 [Ardenticatenaceae bacterium]|nr:hypothetical protein [Ardenticatenaceae bacterium]
MLPGVAAGNEWKRQPDINAMGLKNLRVGEIAVYAARHFGWQRCGTLFTMAPFVLLYFLAAITAVSSSAPNKLTGNAPSIRRRHPRWFWRLVIASLLVVLTALFTLIVAATPPFLLIAWLNPLWDALSSLALSPLSPPPTSPSPPAGASILLEWLLWLIQLVVTPLLAFVRGVDIQSQSLPARSRCSPNDFVRKRPASFIPASTRNLLLIPLGWCCSFPLFRAIKRDWEQRNAT